MVETISPAWERLRELGLADRVEAAWQPGLLVLAIERGSGSFNEAVSDRSPIPNGVATSTGYVGAVPVADALRRSAGHPTAALVLSAALLTLGAAPRPLVLAIDANDRACLLYGRADGAEYATALADTEAKRFARAIPALGADAKRAKAAAHVVIVASARWRERLPGARAILGGLYVLTAPASLAHELIVGDLKAMGVEQPVSPFDTYLPGMYPERVPIALLGDVSICVEITRVLPGGTLVDLASRGFVAQGGDA